MHIDNASRQYTTGSGERRTTKCYLLRRSYRDADGKPRNETLANLSDLPENAISALRLALKGAALVDAESGFDVERSIPHGDIAAAHIMAGTLGLRSLLGPPSRERDIAYALILTRMVRLEWKLSTGAGGPRRTRRWLATTGIAHAGIDDIELRRTAAVPERADREEARPPAPFRGRDRDVYLSSSWVEGTRCELAAFGYSRDGKRGRMQIEYGLLTDPAGRPVAIDVVKGNTADPVAFKSVISKVRKELGLKDLVFVGDRGMITKTRIAELRALEGAGWVTACRPGHRGPGR